MAAQSTKSLVLVVGAGASKEVSLPVGAELKEKIASVLRFNFGVSFSGDGILYDAIRASASERGVTVRDYLDACQLICDAMPQAASIDNFIHHHRQNSIVESCGKLAIARCILRAEHESLLFSTLQDSQESFDFRKLDLTWYNQFFRLLIDDCAVEDLAERFMRVAIIAFNYDRCIEYYLHAALRNYYRMNYQSATELLGNLRIFHPYGSLGPLQGTGGGNAFPFGANPTPQQLISISKEIKTFTEGTDENHSDIAELRATVQSAQRIAFLGFAYNQQNTRLLYGGQREKPKPSQRVYGTAHGLSHSDTSAIRMELAAAFCGSYYEGVQIQNDLTCVQLFHEFSRGLAIR